MNLTRLMTDKYQYQPPMNANTRESLLASIRVHSRFKSFVFAVFLRAFAPSREKVFLYRKPLMLNPTIPMTDNILFQPQLSAEVLP